MGLFEEHDPSATPNVAKSKVVAIRRRRNEAFVLAVDDFKPIRLDFRIVWISHVAPGMACLADV